MKLKHIKNLTIYILVVVILLILGSSAYAYSLHNSYKANLQKGESLMSQGKYEEAKEVFSSIKNGKYFSKNVTLLDNYISDADLLISSTNEFKEGEALFANKKYLEAIEEYKNVDKKDINFQESQNKITLCNSQYVDGKLNESKELAANKNYKEALTILDDILKIYTDNKSALALKDQFASELEEQNRVQLEQQRKAEQAAISNQQTQNSTGYSSNATEQTNKSGSSIHPPVLTDAVKKQKEELDRQFEERAREQTRNMVNGTF